MKQNININKYIIDNKKNLKQENTINYQLRTILDDYELFIVIITILVASNNNIIWIPGIKKSKFCSKKNEKYDIIIECKEREENYE